ncbi:hypothetical protein, partial [Promicromonospora kroppenstedtii]|uniref:hypothetical protein n=1 Tax=Promicromonospora kroppenstedtii TaxID=440482 RepID=UPI0005603805
QAAIYAFKTALRELGEPVPANDVRAVLTTLGPPPGGHRAPTTTVEHYGTPAPVEEIAEFIGDEKPFAVGDKVRVTGNGSPEHAYKIGEVVELVSEPGNSDGLDAFGPAAVLDRYPEAWRTRRMDGLHQWVHPDDLEAA